MEDENQNQPQVQAETSETPKKSNMGMIIAVVVIVLVLLGGAGYYFLMGNKTKSQTNLDRIESAQDAMEDESQSVSVTPEVTTTDSTNDNLTTVQVVVEGAEFKFVPATLTVNKGQKVQVVFKNTGKMLHDFVIDGLEVATKQITGGDEDIVEFTPTEAGVFEYYCSVGNHRALGMVGKLTVK